MVYGGAGDQVNKRGAMTGGYIDQRRSRLKAQEEIRVRVLLSLGSCVMCVFVQSAKGIFEVIAKESEEVKAAAQRTPSASPCCDRNVLILKCRTRSGCNAHSLRVRKTLSK